MVKGPPSTCPLSTAIPSSMSSNNNTQPNHLTRAYGGPSGKQKKRRRRETLSLSKEPDARQKVSTRGSW